MSLLMLLRRMGRDAITTHGFRSTFRTWAAECTNYPREVVEAALAHVVGNKVEAAYQRGDMLDKRRPLMAIGKEHCPPNVDHDALARGLDQCIEWYEEAKRLSTNKYLTSQKKQLR